MWKWYHVFNYSVIEKNTYEFRCKKTSRTSIEASDFRKLIRLSLCQVGDSCQTRYYSSFDTSFGLNENVDYFLLSGRYTNSCMLPLLAHINGVNANLLSSNTWSVCQSGMNTSWRTCDRVKKLHKCDYFMSVNMFMKNCINVLFYVSKYVYEVAWRDHKNYKGYGPWNNFLLGANNS